MPAKAKKSSETKKKAASKTKDKAKKQAKGKEPKKAAKKSAEKKEKSKTKSEVNQEKLILETLEELLSHLQIAAEAEARFDPESNYYYVQIETDNPGMLIGFRGDTLSALQTLVNLLVQEAIKAWPRVVLNVGDYRQRREQTLMQLAKNAAQRVQFSGQPYTFGPLTPAERRVIHLALQDHPGVTTHSEGEHKFRRLVVVPK
jgi:spoIIIJ-associated protein